MGVLSGFKKVKRHVKQSNGYQLLSQWTSSQTVEMDDGSTLEDKISNIIFQCEAANVQTPFPDLYPDGRMEDTTYRKFFKRNCELAYHNSVVRCKELGNKITYNQLKRLIGDYEQSPEAFIGDYWLIDGRFWYIAEICDDALVIIPDRGFDAYITEDEEWGMNASNTTTGGYLNSYMVTSRLPEILSTYITPVFKNSLQEHSGYYTNAVTDGKASGYAEANRIIDIPNSVMIFGYPYDSCERTREHQLALLKCCPDIILQTGYGFGGKYYSYYLRDIASDTKFAAINGGSLGTFDALSSRNKSVCPVFTIGIPTQYSMEYDDAIPYD